MSAIIVDDQIVHYEVLGRGRPVIFLHGWLGSWRYWIPAMQALSAEFRTYAVDFWGFGDTARESSRYSLDQQAHLIHRFMEQLGIVRAAFVGHGLGGLAALRLGGQHADEVDRVMAVSVPLATADLNPRLASTNVPGLVDWLLDRTPLTEQLSTEANKTDPLALEAGLRDAMGADTVKTLEALRAPCLLVHGVNDPAVVPPAEDRASGLSVNLHRIVFDASRHFPMIDEAAKFNRLLTDFLSLKSGEEVSNLQLKEEWKRRVR